MFFLCVSCRRTTCDVVEGRKAMERELGNKYPDTVGNFDHIIGPSSLLCKPEGDRLSAGPSGGVSECQSLCQQIPDCNYFSIWHSGGGGWCRLTAGCGMLGGQKKHSISVYKKRGAPGDVCADVLKGRPEVP